MSDHTVSFRGFSHLDEIPSISSPPGLVNKPVDSDAADTKGKPPPVAASEEGNTERISHRRNGLRRSENANPNAYWGQLTSQQMHLIKDFKSGAIPVEQDFLDQILALEKEKLSKRVEEGKLTSAQEQQKLDKFTVWVTNNILAK